MTKLDFYRDVLSPKVRAKKTALIEIASCQRAIEREFATYNDWLSELYIYDGYRRGEGYSYIPAYHNYDNGKWATELHDEFFTYSEEDDSYYQDRDAAANLRELENNIDEWTADLEDCRNKLNLLNKEIDAARKEFDKL